MRIFLMLLLSCFVNIVIGQDEKPGHRAWGIQSSFSVSFSGYSTSLAGVYKMAYQEIYLGPVLSFTNSYLPQTGPWGFNTGWKYNYANHKKVGAFGLLDYRNSFYRAYDPLNIGSSNWNSIHEINIALGFNWQFLSEWYFNAAIGTGIYLERNHDIYESRIIAHSGYSDLLRISVLKHFHRNEK